MDIGIWQELKVARKKDFGIYLSKNGDDSDRNDSVLLPLKEVPQGVKIGDTLNVFVYLDSEDRPVATLSKPAITLGEFARLKVAGLNNVGAFMNWGLLKDILLPFKEKVCDVKAGEEYLVYMYLDKSNRPCVTQKLHDHLIKEGLKSLVDEDLKEGLPAYVYRISEKGVGVAINDRYHAFIPKNEVHKRLKVGDDITVYLRTDKKGNVIASMQKAVKMQMGDDADKIYEFAKECGGKLPFNDKSSPKDIEKALHMSKGEFKRGVGKLLKEGRLTKKDNDFLIS